MKYILTFIIPFLAGCSSLLVKDEEDISYIVSVTDFMDKYAIDETKSLWYLEKDPMGDLMLSNNRFKVYYLHFFYDKDEIYSCCLDSDYYNDSEKHKTINNYSLIDPEQVINNGYSLSNKKSKIVIYKIKEIEGCKCGKEKVFPRSEIKDFYVPSKLKVQFLDMQQKRMFKKNIDTVSKHFDKLIGIDK